MNEYQESYEKEISLTELLFFCLKKWRWIVIAMVIAAVLAGAYKYSSAVSANRAAQETQGTEKVESKVIPNPNVEYYNRAIENTQQEMDRIQEYMDTSVIMQLDPYHLNTGSLSFYLDTEAGDETLRHSLISAYRNFVTDGRMAEELYQANDSIPKAELQRLISFKSGEQPVSTESYTSSMQQTSALQIQPVEMGQNSYDVFQVEIIAVDEESCGQYTKAAKGALEDYSVQLGEQLGAHKIQLLSESQTESISREIQSYQSEALSAYTADFTQLKTLKEDLKKVLEEEGETIDVGVSASYVNPVSAAVKFMVIGLVLGAFLAAFVLVVIYLMSGRLQSTESFQEEFGIQLLGQVTKGTEKKRIFSFIDRWIQRIEEGEYADITYEEQMKIAAANLKTAAAKNKGLKKVMLVGTIAKEEAEEFRSNILSELDGITLSSYERIVFQASALEKLDNYDGVLFLEKKGSSYIKLIQKEKALVADRNVPVLGAVVL